MRYTWKKLGFKVLLAAVLVTAAPVLAETAGPKTDSEKLDDIQKQLDELKTTLRTLNRSLASLKTLEQEVRDLRTDTTLSVQDAQRQLSELKKEVDQLKTEVAQLRTEADRRRPQPPAIRQAPPSYVFMHNISDWPVTVLVNRRSYRLDPREPQERRLEVPAGTFTYEVLGGPTGRITEQRTRTLNEGGTFSILIHPQP